MSNTPRGKHTGGFENLERRLAETREEMAEYLGGAWVSTITSADIRQLLAGGEGLHCEFMIQLGRFDELGSGVINVNRYLPFYAHGAKSEFREHSSMFTTLLPLAAGTSNTGAAPEKAPEETTQKTTQSSEERILSLLRARPTLSRKQLSDALGDISEDGVKYHLARLKHKGCLRRVGPARGGRWEVVTSNESDRTER